MTVKLNLKINQGETFRYKFLWQDIHGIAIDMTNYTADMQMRAFVDDAAILFELSTTNNRIIITPLTGTIELYISADDTMTLTWPDGVYDLEVTSPTGDVTRLIEGKVTTVKNVTR